MKPTRNAPTGTPSGEAPQNGSAGPVPAVPTETAGTTAQTIAGEAATIAGGDPTAAAIAATAANVGPEKVTQTTASEVVHDAVRPSIGSTGEVRSAMIEQERARSPFDAGRVAFDRSRDLDPTYGGTLPATSRVLPSGQRVHLSSQQPDTEVRFFTTTTRILRSKSLYEPGSPVPLTRREFEAKVAGGSIVETKWDDGEPLFDD